MAPKLCNWKKGGIIFGNMKGVLMIPSCYCCYLSFVFRGLMTSGMMFGLIGELDLSKAALESLQFSGRTKVKTTGNGPGYSG